MAKSYESYLTEEDRIHIAVIKYVSHAYVGMDILHAPLEGKRSEFERYKAVKLGLNLSKGFPDLQLWYKKEELLLELKTVTGVLSLEQIDWIARLVKNGKDARVAYGTDEAIRIIDEKFGALRRVKM
jgi:hypothetical protein